MEILLHSGLEHPNTLWIAITAVVAFVLGIGVTAYRRRLTGLFGDTSEE